MVDVCSSDIKIIAEAMYVQCNIETRSGNHCFSGKPMSIAYCECVSVDFGIQHGPYSHLWPAPHYDIFPHYLVKWLWVGVVVKALRY
jgi:hypothetical protein